MGLFKSIGKALSGAVKSIGSVVKKVALPALGAAAVLIPGAGAVISKVKSIAAGFKTLKDSADKAGGVVPALETVGQAQIQAAEVKAGLSSMLPLAAVGVGAMLLLGGGNSRRW